MKWQKYKLINYQLSQKLKLLGNSEFNRLTNILTIPLTCGPKLPLNKWGPGYGFLTFKKEGRMNARFELMITRFNYILNYRLSQKLKLLGNILKQLKRGEKGGAGGREKNLVL